MSWLSVSNSEKARALATFRAFAEATENVEVKNAVLQQASASIFALDTVRLYWGGETFTYPCHGLCKPAVSFNKLRKAPLGVPTMLD